MHLGLDCMPESGYKLDSHDLTNESEQQLDQTTPRSSLATHLAPFLDAYRQLLDRPPLTRLQFLRGRGD